MKILCETSMRHVHLTQEHVETLFGKGAQLEVDSMLSQPGEFLCKQRVTLVGSKREIDNIAVLGPARKATQVEISRTDAFFLGIKNAPVRASGDVTGTPGIVLQNQFKHKEVKLDEGVIIAKRHVHLDPKTALENGFTDGQIVKIKFEGERAAILDNVVVRVDKDFAPAVHIDSDEANAVFAGTHVTVIK